MNVVILGGTLARDPHISTANTGATVVFFSVATERRFTDSKGEARVFTDRNSCVAFGKQAEQMVDAKEGDAIEVTGEMRTRKQQDREGNDRWDTSVVTNSIALIASEKPAQSSRKPTERSDEAELDSEIPF